MSGKDQGQPGRQALMQTVAAQQKRIVSSEAVIGELKRSLAVQGMMIDYIARMAGLDQHVAAIRKRADADNPAQPVPNPPSENAAESTQEAATPEARDDVRNPGMTPGSVGEVPAETTTTALEPGTTLDTGPFNQLENVQAPVAGTETHVPDEMTRIETDVRVGPEASPTANPEVAFPWTISPNQSNDGARTTASIRLARLQIEAGLAEGESDDLALGARIAASGATDLEINQTVATLESVRKAASRQQQVPVSTVPRGVDRVQRTTPSLAQGGGQFRTAAATSPSDDAEDIFI